jgi:hypothetical protein
MQPENDPMAGENAMDEYAPIRIDGGRAASGINIEPIDDAPVTETKAEAKKYSPLAMGLIRK